MSIITIVCHTSTFGGCVDLGISSEASTKVIVRKANEPLHIEKQTLQSDGHHVAIKT